MSMHTVISYHQEFKIEKVSIDINNILDVFISKNV
jgi:hypothetical protein